MKKTICKRKYDTDIASVIKKKTVGLFGDEAGYEETLYQMPNGAYFLYVNGGSASPYTSENIKSVSKAKAELWLKENE